MTETTESPAASGSSAASSDAPSSGAPSIVIIGNGITGVTAARTIRKLNAGARIQIISKETDYFFSRTALMYIYMGHMRFEDTMPYEKDFWPKNRLELIRDTVTTVDPANKTVRLEKQGALKYDLLLIATGAQSNKFGWPGQDLPRVQGLYSYQDLEELEKNTAGGCERGVIVGGGLIGIEFAEMLHTRDIPVSILVREDDYWDNVLPPEEAQMINREIREHHIDLQLNTELKEILAGENGEARAVVTNKGEEIVCGVVGLTAGVSPNIGVFKETAIECQRGVLVDRFLRTNAPDVYAAGDCAQFREGEKATPPPVEQLWYTGKMHGEIAGAHMAKRAADIAGDSRLAGDIEAPAYDRGIWFNSAKFFTIEYQTYGFVPNRPDADRTYVWIDEEKKKLLRLIWETDGSGASIFTGINLFGMRFRHEVCAAWIREKRAIEYVVDHLKDAWFDPEFFSPTYKRIQKDFNKRGKAA
ncbi:MAG: FAD/NAD(P)-binding oxidoreductase [Leptospirales bacterium]|jgi:NADPH-dependent 2,4-dienoyl-CoA reductase/sulfur reductase-like enzyme